jgi:uncharacterized protein (TIGR02246 family)
MMEVTGKGMPMNSAILTQNEDPRIAVQRAVEAFYAAFDSGFTGDCDFSTEDWNHINPAGGWTRGREAALREVREVHTTFLKGVTDTIEELSVRFAGDDAAVATVISQMSPFTMPGGVRRENLRNIRTFVVVKREGRWKIMQDQNTVIAG